MAWSMTLAAPSYARIETPDWSHPAAEMASMRREDEGEI
jgi:hypothetical protein